MKRRSLTSRMNRGFLAMTLLAGAHCVQGSLIVAERNWNDGTLRGWTSAEPWVAFSSPGAAPDGSMDLALSATALRPNGSAAEWAALAKAQPATLFAGNWQGVQVASDFWSDEAQSPKVKAGGWASSTNASTWGSAILDSSKSAMSTQQWASVASPELVSYLDGGYGSAVPQQFVSDLSAIDWIGTYAWRGSGMGAYDSFDENRFMVPEPAEYMMLAAALVSTGMSLRRRWAAGRTSPAK